MKLVRPSLVEIQPKVWNVANNWQFMLPIQSVPLRGLARNAPCRLRGPGDMFFWDRRSSTCPAAENHEGFFPSMGWDAILFNILGSPWCIPVRPKNVTSHPVGSACTAAQKPDHVTLFTQHLAFAVLSGTNSYLCSTSLFVQYYLQHWHNCTSYIESWNWPYLWYWPVQASQFQVPLIVSSYVLYK